MSRTGHSLGTVSMAARDQCVLGKWSLTTKGFGASFGVLVTFWNRVVVMVV
jgi:hypothetical protein